jgi:hypothetical protein
MKLDIFINRPVLSTVFSVFFLLLGLIGLTQFASVTIPRYCTSHHTGGSQLSGSKCPDGNEQCDCPNRGTD